MGNALNIVREKVVAGSRPRREWEDLPFRGPFTIVYAGPSPKWDEGSSRFGDHQKHTIGGVPIWRVGVTGGELASVTAFVEVAAHRLPLIAKGDIVTLSTFQAREISAKGQPDVVYRALAVAPATAGVPSEAEIEALFDGSADKWAGGERRSRCRSHPRRTSSASSFRAAARMRQWWGSQATV